MKRLAKFFEFRRDPVDQALDQAVDRANDTMDEMHEVQTDETLPFACVEDMGHAAGVKGAQADLAAGTVSSAGLSRHVSFDFDRAYADCRVDDHADHGSYTMPDLANPLAAGLSVALQPSMANAGEAELLQARDLYQAAVDDGYRQTARESFQQQLDDRLSVNWNQPGDTDEHGDAGRSDAFDIPAVGFVSTDRSFDGPNADAFSDAAGADSFDDGGSGPDVGSDSADATDPGGPD